MEPVNKCPFLEQYKDSLDKCPYLNKCPNKKEILDNKCPYLHKVLEHCPVSKKVSKD
jgi:hypothetical protein